MPAQYSQADQRRIFNASGSWTSNVWGAVLGGFGAAILISVLGGIVLWNRHPGRVVLFLGGLAAVLIISLICLFPGNWIAVFPYQIVIEDRKGLWLHAPLRKVFIPFDELRDVRQSVLQQGFVVRLKRRRRLLTRFMIHWFFGPEAEPLVLAIRDQIRSTDRDADPGKRG